MQNEKLNEFLSAAMEAARQAGSLAADVAYGIGQIAEEKAGAARRYFQAARVEGQMEETLMDVGKLLYATHTGSPTDSDVLEEKLREVDALAAELENLRSKKAPDGDDGVSGDEAGTAGGPVCPDCGQTARAGDLFCRNCGGKL